MSRPAIAWRVSLAALLVGLAVLGLTPVGVWLATAAVDVAAETRGWELEVGDHSGALASRAVLRSVHLRQQTQGLDIEITELSLAPWSWEVELQKPHVRWQQTPTEESTATTKRDTVKLPLADLPVVVVVGGAFEFGAGDRVIEASDINARLSPTEEQMAEVDLSLGNWSIRTDAHTIASGSVRSRWHLTTTTVQLQEAFIRAVAGETQATLRGTGVVELAPTLDISSSFIIEGATHGLEQLWLDASVEGSLAPLVLQVTAQGEATHPSLGPLKAQAAGSIDSALVRADSFDVDVAGGHVAGGATWRSAGGLDVVARIDGIGLTGLTNERLAGILQGRVELHGDVDNPHVRTELQAFQVLGIAPDPIDLVVNAELEDHRLTAHLVCDQVGTLDVEGDLDRTQHDLRLQGELDVAPWLGRSWPLSVRGRLHTDTLAVGLSTARLPFGDEPPGPVRMEVTLSAWRHLDLGFVLDGGQVLAHARMDLAKGQLDTLTASSRGLSLAHLSRMVTGQLHGRIAAGGMLGLGARGEVLLRVDDLGIAGWRLGPTTLSTRFVDGVASIEAGAPGLELHAVIDTSGTTSVDGLLQNAIIYRENGRDSIRLTGRFRGVAPIGHVASGAMQVELDSARAEFSGWKMNLPEGVAAEYTDGEARLTTTRMVTPLGTVHLGGVLASDHLDFAARIDSFDTADLEGITAQGAGRLSVYGSAEEPRAQLRAGLKSLALGGRELGELTATLELSDSLRGTLQLGVPSATTETGSGLTINLSAPNADFRVGASTGQEQAHIRLEANRLDASTIATYALDDSTHLRVSLSADLTFPAKQLLHGINWRDLSGQLVLRELDLARDRVRLRLAEPSRAELSGGMGSTEGFDLPVEIFRRDTEAFEPAGVIHIEAQLAGAGGGLMIRAEDLELEAVARAIPGRVSLPAGLLSLQANLTGTSGALALDATAEVELDELGQLSARVFGRPRKWNASATWVSLVEDSLRVTASAPAVNVWPKWDELTMRVQSNGFDLLPMLDQIPQLASLTGIARIDVTADSLLTNPHLSGRIEIEELQLALLDVKPGYEFPAGEINFGDRDGGGAHAELAGFSGRTTRGEGRLQLDGFYDLLPGGRTDYQLQLTGENVRYEYDDVFDAPEIDLDLALRRQGQGSLLAGNVRLNKPKADIQLVDLTTPPVPPPPALQNEFLENTSLDLYVDIDGLQTHSELSDITLEGQTRVYGTFYQPRFQGELEITDGQVIILNRQFDFSRGRIVLDQLLPTYSILDLMYDPILLDPELDLEAKTTVQPNDRNEPEVEVTMTLAGPVRSAAPRLTAPGHGDGAVLNLLAFGQTTPANYASALYTAAGQLLLSRQVERVGIDEFLLLPSGTALGTVGKSAVRIGKFLSWPVPIWVRYEANTLEASRGQFEVEYRITSWMTIDASAYSEYQLYGLGLGLSREF